MQSSDNARCFQPSANGDLAINRRPTKPQGRIVTDKPRLLQVFVVGALVVAGSHVRVGKFFGPKPSTGDLLDAFSGPVSAARLFFFNRALMRKETVSVSQVAKLRMSAPRRAHSRVDELSPHRNVTELASTCCPSWARHQLSSTRHLPARSSPAILAGCPDLWFLQFSNSSLYALEN